MTDILPDTDDGAPPRDLTPDELDRIQAIQDATTRPTNTRTTGHQPPPHDIASEEALLGACLLSNDAHTAAADTGITAASFYKPNHAHVYAAIDALHAHAQPVDPVTVAAQLRNAGLDGAISITATLAHLMAATPATTNAGHYAAIVHAHHQRRQLLDAAVELTAAAHDNNLDRAARIAAAVQTHAQPADRTRLTTGGAFILDTPTNPEPVWGDHDQVIWARGEGLLLVGPPGVGKTTITGQLLDALTDDNPGELLGAPINPSVGRVLYLACDRPRQIARAMARRFTDTDRARLEERLTIWQGPPPRDLGKHPETLAQLAHDNGATTVIIDSLKDVAVNLNDDEVGANLNRAIQTCNAEGIDVLANHHQRKGQGGTRPKSLEDVYGSTWITAGAGSVVLLWGAAGDLIVELTHLKQPATEFGPLTLAHDHDQGTTTIHRGFDLLAYLRNVNGPTTTQVARAQWETTEPTDNQHRKTLRNLDRAEQRGLVHGTDSPRGGPGGTPGRRWYLTDTDHPA